MILMFDGSIHDGGGNVHGFPGIFSPGEEKNPPGAEALGGMGDQSKKRQPLGDIRAKGQDHPFAGKKGRLTLGDGASFADITTTSGCLFFD